MVSYLCLGHDVIVACAELNLSSSRASQNPLGKPSPFIPSGDGLNVLFFQVSPRFRKILQKKKNKHHDLCL
ncbi:hypothetical protein RRG08_024274 [Elysia crispata]|uniref:Uncharacterized protein n=1 Tax=Elysia crispata TaxID=231223 RepID=A0AAE0Z278_9GAST|nr:hypothetical protein RRG08_024274 [Elysia crispata]